MKALIIANGTPLAGRTVRALARAADLVVCADGGANTARALRILPDVILGDFDSVTPATLRFFRTVHQMRIREQESTDLEKSIRYCLSRGVDRADVVGGTGDRIDHTTGALGCFRKFGDRITLRFLEPGGEILAVGRRLDVTMRRGEACSLIPVGRCTGVTTRGLRYGLRDEILELGVREGISNAAGRTRVVVTVRRGTLLLFRRSSTPRNR